MTPVVIRPIITTRVSGVAGRRLLPRFFAFLEFGGWDVEGYGSFLGVNGDGVAVFHERNRAAHAGFGCHMADHEAVAAPREAPVRDQRGLQGQPLAEEEFHGNVHFPHSRSALGPLVPDDHDLAVVDQVLAVELEEAMGADGLLDEDVRRAVGGRRGAQRGGEGAHPLSPFGTVSHLGPHTMSVRDAALIERLRVALREQASKEGIVVTNVSAEELIVHLAPLSPVANETWVFWEFGRKLFHFASDIDLANPAVTLARAATDTFAGIRPQDVPGFVVAQLLGAGAATLLLAWLGVMAFLYHVPHTIALRNVLLVAAIVFVVAGWRRWPRRRWCK